MYIVIVNVFEAQDAAPSRASSKQLPEEAQKPKPSALVCLFDWTPSQRNEIWYPVCEGSCLTFGASFVSFSNRSFS